MTLVQQVKQLQEKGNKIKFRYRSDGSIIVTEINGVKYKDAKGNAVIRQMTGTSLSQKKIQQLKTIKPPKKVPPKARKKPPVPSIKEDLDIRRALKTTQKVWKKKKSAEKNMPVKPNRTIEGTYTLAGTQRHFKDLYQKYLQTEDTQEEAYERARQETLDALIRAERYGADLVSIDRVTAFIGKLALYENEFKIDLSRVKKKLEERQYALDNYTFQSITEIAYNTLEHMKLNWDKNIIDETVKFFEQQTLYLLMYESEKKKYNAKQNKKVK